MPRNIRDFVAAQPAVEGVRNLVPGTAGHLQTPQLSPRGSPKIAIARHVFVFDDTGALKVHFRGRARASTASARHQSRQLWPRAEAAPALPALRSETRLHHTAGDGGEVEM